MSEHVARLREIVDGTAPAPEAMTAYLAKVHERPYTVTDADVDALRRRYTEDQLFEIIVSAAFGAAAERLAAARKSLEEA